MKNYLNMISWFMTEKDQLKNVQMFADDEKYGNEMFVQKGEKKSWENEAKVLALRGYPKIKDVLPKLFEWLQDMNWPGAPEIAELLSTLPKEVLIENLEKATLEAKSQKDVCWLYWLREFMEQNELVKDDFNNKEVFDILESSIDM